MELTIYNTYVPMENQEQCDRFKQVCLDNGLKLFYTDFHLDSEDLVFRSSVFEECFWLWHINSETYTQVTESEWLELLKAETSNTLKS